MGITGISGLQPYQKYSVEKANIRENSNEAVSARTDQIQISREGRMAAELKANSSKNANEEYFKNLQKQVPYIHLQIGNGININNDGKVNIVDVSPKLLEKMRNDPQAAKEYTQRLKDVEAATKWVDGFEKSMGYTAICRHGYIDENGKFSNFAIVVKKDELNERLRKEAQEKTEKWIEKSRENAREKAAELLKEKFEKSENGEIFLDNDDIQTIIDESKTKGNEPIQEKQDTASTESDKAEAKESGIVVFNAAKRARQLAAASTSDQVRVVMDLLDGDLADCKEGLAKGWCDENEVAAVKAMIQKAKEHMRKVSKEDNTVENQNLQDMTFNLVSLM